MRSISRRAFLNAGSATALGLALPWPGFAAARDVYRDAIVIDGLGGFGNSKGAPGAPLTRIGTFTPDKALILRTSAGDGELPLGYGHFRGRSGADGR